MIEQAYKLGVNNIFNSFIDTMISFPISLLTAPFCHNFYHLLGMPDP